MWSTKPPLMIWLQVAGIKLFGINELAIRLPSAMAVFATLMLIYWFCAKHLNNKLLGLCSILVLVTIPGYLQDHVGRTGDYDALLIFFTSLYCLAFFIFSETGKIKYLYLTWIGITLSVLTKGISGLFFIPVLIGYSFYKKNVGRILRNKHFYFSAVFFLIISGGYYLIRELKNPGYLKAMIGNEVTGRYLNTLENHQHGFWYYINNLFEWQAGQWLFFIPLSLAVLVFYKNATLLKRFSALAFVLIIFLVLIISTAGTKLSWYIAPVYPFLAILAAIPLVFFIEFFCNIEILKDTKKRVVILALVLIAIFAQPYKNAVEFAYQIEKNCCPPHLYGYFMKALATQKKYIVSHKGYNAPVHYYIEMQKTAGFDITTKKDQDLSAGDTVMVCEEEIINNIRNRYNVSVVKSWNHCELLAIQREKP